jgi:hypothetical protein
MAVLASFVGDPDLEFSQLTRLFDDIRGEHLSLRERPFDKAEHEAHLVRLRELVDAIHAWRLKHA